MLTNCSVGSCSVTTHSCLSYPHPLSGLSFLTCKMRNSIFWEFCIFIIVLYEEHVKVFFFFKSSDIFVVLDFPGLDECLTGL